LPREEAVPILRELVQCAIDVKSEPRSFQLTGNPEDPELGSENERRLFLLVPALQSIEPDLAQFVLGNRPQLAAAAKRFPLGMQSVYEAQRKYDPSQDDVMTIGQSQVIPMAEALATEFEAAFREAYDRFAKDCAPPNDVPKECWPSAYEFRNILFKAGQHQGLAAQKHLDRIPDANLCLFAQIELCAAIAGLPQIGGCIVERSSRPLTRSMPSPAELDRMIGPILQGIRCPKCQWTPRAKNIWACKCGHRWNTFDTRGLCPRCRYQWEITACLQCGATSPHLEWYVRQ
jgi:hypothetical protein